MKTIPLVFASAISIAFPIFIIDKAISKPTSPQLPIIGIIKQINASTYFEDGCKWWQSDNSTKIIEKDIDNLQKSVERLEKTKKTTTRDYIKVKDRLNHNFYLLHEKIIIHRDSALDADKITMNFNKKNILLSQISQSSKKGIYKVAYKTGKIIVEITTQEIPGEYLRNSYERGTVSISIQNSNVYKMIKIKGTCTGD